MVSVGTAPIEGAVLWLGNQFGHCRLHRIGLGMGLTLVGRAV